MKANLTLIYSDGYWPKKNIDDEKLSLLWELTREIPIYKPEWLIKELENKGIGGMNVVEFDYEDSDIIISNQFNSYDEGGSYIRIEKKKLFELIRKYAELASRKVPTISFTRLKEEYLISES